MSSAPQPVLEDEGVLARAAFGTALASLTFALIFVPLHPHPHTFVHHPLSLLEQVVRHQRLWLVDHLGIAATDLSGTASLVFLALLLMATPARRFAQLALASAIATTGLILAFVALDGFATRDAALAWQASGGSTSSASYAVAAGVVRAADGVETLGQILFFGLTFALFGVTVLRSGIYPRALGWAGVAAGSFGIGSGVFRAVHGTDLLSGTLLGTSGGVSSAWVVAAGYLVWRHSRRTP